MTIIAKDAPVIPEREEKNDGVIYPPINEVVEFTNDLPAKEAEYKKIIAEKREQYKDLTIAGITDKAGYKAVDDARKDMKNMAVGVVKYCKNLRDAANKFCTAVISKEKEIVTECKDVEHFLAKMQDDIDAEKLRLETERTETRLATIRQYSPLITADAIKHLNDELFGNMVANAKEAFEIEQKRLADLEVVKKAEEEKQAKIKADNEAETKRLEAVRKEQAEAQAKIDEEKKALYNAKKQNRINALKAIGFELAKHETELVFEDMNFTIQEIMEFSDTDFEKQAAISKIEVEARNKIFADKLEADKIRIQEEAAQKERERIAAEEKKKQDEKAAAELEAKQRAELAPDKEKLKVYATSLSEIKAPTLTTNKAQEVCNSAYIYIQKAIEILNGGAINL